MADKARDDNAAGSDPGKPELSRAPGESTTRELESLAAEVGTLIERAAAAGLALHVLDGQCHLISEVSDGQCHLTSEVSAGDNTGADTLLRIGGPGPGSGSGPPAPGDGPGLPRAVATYYSHRSVLCARSGYFAAMFREREGQMTFSEGKRIVVELAGLPCPDTLEPVLNYIYSGSIKDISLEPPSRAVGVALNADYLDVDGGALEQAAVMYLARNWHSTFPKAVMAAASAAAAATRADAHRGSPARPESCWSRATFAVTDKVVAGIPAPERLEMLAYLHAESPTGWDFSVPETRDWAHGHIEHPEIARGVTYGELRRLRGRFEGLFDLMPGGMVSRLLWERLQDLEPQVYCTRCSKQVSRLQARNEECIAKTDGHPGVYVKKQGWTCCNKFPKDVSRGCGKTLETFYRHET